MRDVINDLQDLRYLQWAKTRKSSGTAGTFLKSYDETGPKKKYYKLSDYDSVKGIVGHECVNEIIAQRLLELLGIEHLEYRLIHALVNVDDKEYETYLCESEDFKEPGESKIPLEDYYAMEKTEGESPVDFCLRMGWENHIYEMWVIDYLILNRDRHGANIEILFNKKGKSIRFAPLFDHGLSLLCRCHDKEELKAFDVMEDRKVQSFLGSNSTYDNLLLIPKDYLQSIPSIDPKDKSILFSGLDNALEKEYFDKMWKMIMKRWETIDSIRNT